MSFVIHTAYTPSSAVLWSFLHSRYLCTPGPKQMSMKVRRTSRHMSSHWRLLRRVIGLVQQRTPELTACCRRKQATMKEEIACELNDVIQLAEGLCVSTLRPQQQSQPLTAKTRFGVILGVPLGAGRGIGLDPEEAGYRLSPLYE